MIAVKGLYQLQSARFRKVLQSHVMMSFSLNMLMLRCWVFLEACLKYKSAHQMFFICAFLIPRFCSSHYWKMNVAHPRSNSQLDLAPHETWRRSRRSYIQKFSCVRQRGKVLAREHDKTFLTLQMPLGKLIASCLPYKVSQNVMHADLVLNTHTAIP